MEAIALRIVSTVGWALPGAVVIMVLLKLIEMFQHSRKKTNSTTAH